jgi:hypothetical protein
MEEVYGNVEGQQRRFDDVKAKASQAGEVAKRKLVEKAEAQKGELTSRLEKVARELEDIGQKAEGPEGQIFSRLGGYVRKAEGMIEGKQADELAAMAARELKQRPALLMAGCFAAGFFGARLLK